LIECETGVDDFFADYPCLHIDQPGSLFTSQYFFCFREPDGSVWRNLPIVCLPITAITDMAPILGIKSGCMELASGALPHPLGREAAAFRKGKPAVP